MLIHRHPFSRSNHSAHVKGPGRSGDSPRLTAFSFRVFNPRRPLDSHDSANHAASIVATFVSVFPDADLWIDPVDSTGILLGRQDGEAEPLGTSWPGLLRRAEGRNLGADQIRSSLLLDRHALARYAGGVPLVTDDNQLLQFSDLRNGLGGQRGRRLIHLNRSILSNLAGRPIYSTR